MQLCVNSVQKWVSENGFKFFTPKLVCIHFHQQYGFFPEPNILLGKTPTKMQKQTKIFVSGGTFMPRHLPIFFFFQGRFCLLVLFYFLIFMMKYSFMSSGVG